MVDFNNAATVGIPATDVEKICVLQRRDNMIEAIESTNIKKQLNANPAIHIMKARLYSLFLNLQPALKRNKTKTYEVIEQLCRIPKDYNECMQGFTYLNTYLDEIKITRLDTIKTYDQDDIEAENKMKGY